jgi:hypothetical protein
VSSKIKLRILNTNRASKEDPSGLAAISLIGQGKAISERTLARVTIAQNGTCQIPTDK